MKQTFTYKIMLAAFALFSAAGCSNDEMDNQPKQPDDTAESSGVEVQFTAGLAPETKTSYTSDGKADEGFIVEWKGYDTDQTNYDKVTIYGVKKENGQLWQMGGAKHVPYRLKTSGKTSSLEPDPNPITLTAGCIYNFYSCYPYKDNGRDAGYMDVPGPKLKTQTQSAPNDNTHLGEYDFMVASHTDITVNSVENPLQVNFQYKHLYTSLQFNIKNTRTTPVKIKKITLARQDGNTIGYGAVHRFDVNETIAEGFVSSLSLAITTPEELAANSAQTQKFWMMIVPSSIPGGKELKLSVHLTDGNGVSHLYTLKKAVPTGGFEAGYNYTLEMNVKEPDPSSDTESWTTVIGTKAELEAFRDDVNNANTYEGKTVRLTNHINLLNETWTPIGIDNMLSKVFKGTFDGGGYHISNLNVENRDVAGLFGYVEGATVRNLHVSGQVTSTGNIVGGIAGDMSDGIMENCIFSGTVNGTGNVGGIVGDCDRCQIVGCYTKGSVTATESSAGGIAGKNFSSTIDDCYSEANVTAPSVTGGIVGRITGISAGTVTHCYAMGAISAKYTVGCIAGTNDGIVRGCIALNPSFTRMSDDMTFFGRISGGGTVTNCAAFTGMTLPDGITPTDNANGKDGASLTKEQCLTATTYTDRGFTTDKGWAFDSNTSWQYLPWNKAFESFPGINATDYKISVPNHLKQP